MGLNWEGMTAEELLRWGVEEFGEKVAFASSFGAEDMVVTDLLLRITPHPRIFTLDTGRLPQETYELIQRVREHYSIQLEVYFPDTSRVEAMVREHGINLFYESPEKRKLCCHIRKVEPLQRALSGLSAWITGLRREQSNFRHRLAKVEQEEGGRLKINPLADWTEEQVWDYLRRHRVPYNRLHDLHYRSIGCAPCTRPVQPGEDFRAGRWWWEQETKKECGLHVR